MYKGTINKPQGKLKYQQEKAVLMLTTEEVEQNGVIVQQYVYKETIFENDPRIRVTDYNVLNLQRMGIDVKTMAESKLSPTLMSVGRSAEKANEVITDLQTIKQLDNEIFGETAQA